MTDNDPSGILVGHAWHFYHEKCLLCGENATFIVHEDLGEPDEWGRVLVAYCYDCLPVYYTPVLKPLRHEHPKEIRESDREWTERITAHCRVRFRKGWTWEVEEVE